MKCSKMDELRGLLTISKNINVIENTLKLIERKKANNEKIKIYDNEIDLDIITDLLILTKKDEEERVETYMNYLTSDTLKNNI